MTEYAFAKIAAGLDDAIAIAQGKADPASYRVHPAERVDVPRIPKEASEARAPDDDDP